MDTKKEMSVSESQMELFKNVSMKVLSFERQKIFEDVWNGNYFLYLTIDNMHQILFRWKSEWIYGVSYGDDSDWVYRKGNQNMVLNFFIDSRSSLEPFKSEDIIEDIRRNWNEKMTLRYTHSRKVIEYPYDEETNDILWKYELIVYIGEFVLNWVELRRCFEYYKKA